MYLKQLETVGFKSFAERIQIDFVPGITAIVGPNGSGKSNVTDAIRWVLGEQSVRSLRGSKMEDVIFQGSDSRNPLNVAEVTLLLDNSNYTLPLDYEEVSVTRRIYRSGASEFYINKQACRLKDIIDLFMDSGLGREAFSIISQGQVSEILSSKAEERRTIFEDAAGVLKYKQRKQTAEYKLAETEENLHRINDIIYELEQQIEPLKEQANTAKKYLEQKEILKKHEISLLIAEIEQYHEKWQTLLQSIEQSKHEEIQLKTTIQQSEANLEKKRKYVQDLDETIAKLQENLLDHTKELEQLEGKKQVLHERSKHFAKNKQMLEAQINQTTEKIAQLKQTYTEEKQTLDQLLQKKQTKEQKINNLRHQLTTEQDDLATQIEELKSEYIEKLSEQAAKRNEKKSLEEQKQKLSVQENEQFEKFEQLKHKRQTFINQKNEIQAKKDEQLKLVTNYEEKLRQYKENLHHLQAKKDDDQRKLYKMYETLAKLKSRQEMLIEMKTDYQGFYQGVKAVLQASEKGQLANVFGAVLQLIDVPETFLTAIEMVLGGKAQHIVVQHKKDAQKAIHWLKRHNKGRATFLPIESVQPRFIPQKILHQIKHEQGFIDIAAQLVTTDAKYQPVINHLMGHVVVADNLEVASRMAQLMKYRFRVVTLKGDIVHPGGSISGGTAYRRNQSLFTREKDLQDVSQQVKTYEKQIQSLEEQLNKQQAHIDKQQATIAQTETILKRENEQLRHLETNIREINMELTTLNETIQNYEQEKDRFKKDKQTFVTREHQLTETLNNIGRQLDEIETSIDALTKKDTTLKENEAQLQETLHQYQISFAELEERSKHQREKTEEIKQQLQDLQKQHEASESNLQQLLDETYEKRNVAELTESMQTKQQLIDQMTKDMQHKRTLRLKYTQLIEDEEREIREEHKKHEKLLQHIQETEVKANRIDVQLENKLSHLQSQYAITYEKAKQTYEKSKDIEATKIAVEKVKQAIDELGTVNLGAIDEYKRISERYTFLTEQKADLVEAKESLLDIIAEMDDEMKNRFSTTFKQIKEEFAVVFKELFNGGRAELKLTDPKDLLHTGIDIVAQPPGKKLQHLGLLSGGERALTAIALLFAILRVRPVPFCVLDEVEAALDEANVVRFANYLKMHSENIQFIVITHQKGTMEEADVLYGITMQESGVSRIVSVLLEDMHAYV